MCQHALGDCTIKFESNSFRILLSAGYNSFELFDAVEDAVSSRQPAVSRLNRLSLCQRKACSGSKLLRLPVKSLLLLGCCFAAGSGYYRCQLSCVATNVDQEKPVFPMPFACRTAAKLGLCC